MFNKPWDWLRNLGAAVAVVTASAALVWYFATLEGRVRSIEAQLQQIRTSPVASFSSEKSINLIKEACVKLASDYVAAQNSFNYETAKAAESASVAIKNLMTELGCLLDKESPK